MKRIIALAVAFCMILVPCFSFSEEDLGQQNGWVTQDDNTYYYENGSKVLGKFVISDEEGNENTYYFDEETGAMCTGFIDIGSYRYYFSKTTGKMFTGWHKISGDKYYFTSKGHAYKGLHKIGENKYYFDEETYALVKGFKDIGDYRYYFGKNTGKMITGWATINDNKYYFGSNGHMYKGFHKIKDHTYYFGKTSGKRFYGWHKIGGKKYYFSSKKGRMYTGIHKIGKNVYTFSSKGVLTRTVYGSKKAVALTYDDGPSSNTDTILTVLKKYDALATFFVVGNRISSYQSSLEKAYNMGCQIGNHSWSHPWYQELSSSGVKTQIKKCNNKVKKVTGEKPTVCRTPGGDTHDFVKKAVNMPIILWSIDTRDWETQNASKTYKAVMNYVSDGDIILMHDLYSATASASKKIIPALDKKGYQMVTVKELALLKGKSLKAGKVYYSFK